MFWFSCDYGSKSDLFLTFADILGGNDVCEVIGKAIVTSKGPLTGGSRFPMSILRKVNVALSNLRNAHVTLSILRNAHVPCHYLLKAHVACH